MVIHSRSIGLMMGLLSGITGYAQPLSTLWPLAEQGEPGLLAAQAAREGAAARQDQASGGLLPQLSASANGSTNYRRYETRTTVHVPEDKDHFKSHSAQLNLTQPLWRPAARQELTQTGLALQQADQQWQATLQELRAKLVSTWLDLLAADDAVTLNQRQLASAEFVYRQAQRGSELGHNGRPQAEEAQARWQQTQADLAASQAEREAKLAALEQITGPLAYFASPQLAEPLPSLPPLPNVNPLAEATWPTALQDSPRVQAASLALEAAEAEVRKQRAGHQPTLDVVGSYSRNSQTTGSTPGASGYRTVQATVGLQLNVPLYTGGTQSAKVAEAVAAAEKARQEREQALRELRLTVKQAWYGSQAAQARVSAAARAMAAQQVVLQAARRSESTGLKNHADVLQAEVQEATLRRDWRKAVYDHFTAWARLKAAAGQLSVDDLARLDGWFQPATVTP